MDKFKKYKRLNDRRKANNPKASGFARFWNKRSKLQKSLIISGVGLICATVILVGVAGIAISSILGKIERDSDFNKLNNEDLGFTQSIDEDIVNIALFGIDTQTVDTFSGNSDSIMILSLNQKDKAIKLVSVMRDSLVPIERNGKSSANKINSAYASGGPALAVKTLNTVFNLDIKEYATVNFFGMIDIIDEVGGIDAEITQSEITCSVNINTHIKNQCQSLGIDANPYLIKAAGKQHLNGIQAVAYARVRYGTNWLGSSNDFGRTERQRYVMEQLLKKALSLDITSYPSLVSKLAPYIKTSFNNSELLGLANFLKDKPIMKNSRIPHDEYIINADFRKTGASSIYFNYKYAAKVLHAYLYDNIEPSDYIAANGVDKTEWYGVSSGSTSSKKPTSSSGATSSSSGSSSSGSSQGTSSSEASSEPSSEAPVSSNSSSEIESQESSSVESQDVSSEAESSSQAQSQ